MPIGLSGFRPEIFQPYPLPSQTPTDDTAVLLEPVPEPGQGISYSRTLHGLHREFCNGPLFSTYRDEMRRILVRLAHFAIQGGVPEAEKKQVLDGFNHLYVRRFNQAYQERYAELIDSVGKRSLEHILAMTGDESIPLETRRAVILDLSRNVGVCEAGTVANLIAAERSLLMSVGGIKARLWKIKEDCTRAVLEESVYEKFGHLPGYILYEIHYVHSVWNYLADEIGLERIRDIHAPQLQDVYPDFLDACRQKVYAAITPEKFANMLAEQSLAIFTSEVLAYGKAMAGDCTQEILDVFDAALGSVQLDLRLGIDRLPLHAFVQADDNYQHYKLRTDATLISVALLNAIHAERLMDDLPMPGGEWQDDSGQRAVLFAYGDLAWQSRLRDGVPIEPVWSSRGASPELLSVADLRAWKEAQGKNGPRPPLTALRATIRSADPSDLIDMPADWLVDADTVLALLARLGHGDGLAQRYLHGNLAYFLERFPYDQRAALIDGVLGTADAAVQLAQRWYPDPWAILTEVCPRLGTTRLQRWMAQRRGDAIDLVRVLAENGWGIAPESSPGKLLIYQMLRGPENRPLLYDAMSTGNVTAIDAWRRLLCSPVVLPHVKGVLFELLSADPPSGMSALSMAMQQNQAQAIESFHALLTDPAIASRIKGKLPRLVSGMGSPLRPVSKDRHALTVAMQCGAASAIRSYRALLADPAIFPHIRYDLLDLLGGARDGGDDSNRRYRSSPLWWAMNRGHADAIREFHAILTTPGILEGVRYILPDMIAAKAEQYRVPALHIALANGRAMAIQAYHEMVADSRIRSQIAGELPRLLAAEDMSDTPGLARALRSGHASAIKSFHEMLVDDAILPCIYLHLPRLLKAQPLGEEVGLAQALAAGNAQAITAFHAMLVDPKILPNVRRALPKILIARRVSAMKGLEGAAQRGYLEAISAFRAILVDPKVFPDIQSAIRQRMLASRHSSAARDFVSVRDPESGELDMEAMVSGRPVSISSRAADASGIPAPVDVSMRESEINRWLIFYIRSRATPRGLFARMLHRMHVAINDI